MNHLTPSPNLLTRTPRMHELLEVARRYAATDYPVLIGGETGTGKAMLARFLHGLSTSRHGPFAVEGAGAIPDSLLEAELFGHVRGAFTGAVAGRQGLLAAASGGTLFLDGIEDASPHLQLILLRFLQQGTIRPVGAEQPIPVKLRLISSSGLPLAELERRLRSDFFHRINTLQLELPPLRERVEDLPLLAGHFAREAGWHRELPEKLLEILASLDWPGNVRQLRNEITSLILAGDCTLDPARLVDRLREQAPVAPPRTVQEAVARAERNFILAALKRNDYHRIRTASEMRVSKTWLYKKIGEYRLDAG